VTRFYNVSRLVLLIQFILKEFVKKLFQYYLPYKKNIALAVLCNILMSLFLVVSIPVLQPFLQILFNQNKENTPIKAPEGDWNFKNLEQHSSWFFNQLIQTHGREKALLYVCIAIVFVFLGKNIFRYLSLFFIAPVRNGIVRDFRGKLVAKIHELPLSYFSDERKGDLMSRITADVQEIEYSILGVVEAIFREPIIIIGSLSFMIFVSPSLTLFVFVLMLFMGTIIATISRTLKSKSNNVQSRLGTLVSLVEESLSGLRIIKGFNAEKFQNQRFSKENDNYAKDLTGIYRQRELASPLSEFMGISVVCMLLWYGSRQVFSGSMTAETFITLLYAFYNVIEPAKSLASSIFSIRKGMGALERVENLLNAEQNIKDPVNPLILTEFKDKIAFKDVSFQYNNAETAAINSLNFEIKKGEIIALVGASGAGKSTIADLLPRFFEVTSGQILLDGQDIRSYKMQDLRGLMGIVSQEAILFNDTIWNNIAFGMEQCTETEIIAAAKAANAHEFIEKLPQGYHSNIGDSGSKLSGGQRQRLTIARALLKNPPILILDEATSALDSASEQLVQVALERLMKNRTALVIAHRLSTIQHANTILVLERGLIVERGNHEYLMQNGQIYPKLVALQGIN
jgi:ABC-type multidrug transport system fused ATPase/permease subunit